MKRPYLVTFLNGLTRVADFAFMHKDGGACFVDIGWDTPGQHPFHIVDGPIEFLDTQWTSFNGITIRELTENDDEWQHWSAWIRYKTSPEGARATDDVAISACERDGALIGSDGLLHNDNTVKTFDLNAREKSHLNGRMMPCIKEKSVQGDTYLESILACICEINCNTFFTTHLLETQAEQKKLVARYQNQVLDRLRLAVPRTKWFKEYLPSITLKDAVDIYGENTNSIVAIELDKSRADQVAKKFLSRAAILHTKKLYYISLCYPGTDKMSINECLKYFGYCSDISRRMSVVYAGLVIQKAVGPGIEK